MSSKKIFIALFVLFGAIYLYILNFGHYKMNFLINTKSSNIVYYEFYKIPSGYFRGYNLERYDERKGYICLLQAFYANKGYYNIKNKIEDICSDTNKLKLTNLDLDIEFNTVINLDNYKLEKYLVNNNKVLFIFSNYDEKYKFMNFIGYFIVNTETIINQKTK